MKKQFLFLFLFLFSIGVFAQDAAEALRFAQTQALGTARSAAVGGAFGALGADLSCFSFNPAGISLYRQAEAGLSISGLATSNQSTLFQSSSSTTKTGSSTGLNSLGIVGLVKSTDQSGWVSVNYGFAYNKIKDFNNSIISKGINSENSITDFFGIRGGHLTEAELGQNTTFIDQWAQPAYQNNLIIRNPDAAADANSYYSSVLVTPYENQQQVLTTSGSIGEYSFALAGNYENKLYIGASLAITTINYEESNVFSESKDSSNLYPVFDKYSMKYDQTYKVSGSGYNLKLGVIYSPIPELRIGLGLHTPSYYDLSLNYLGKMSSSFTINNPSKVSNYSTPDDSYKFDYQYKSPMRLNASLAYIIARTAFLSIDYEYVDYANSTFNSTDDPFDDVNSSIKQNYKGGHNVKLGAEYKLGSALYLRAGYNRLGSPYQNINGRGDGVTNTYSAGLGFHVGSFFIDFAYLMSKTNETQFFYQVPANWGRAGADIVQTSNRSIITVSYKF